MLAALLAALMSSLTSILNSASSIMTMDLWRQFRKTASLRIIKLTCSVSLFQNNPNMNKTHIGGIRNDRIA
jgi:Na+/proline symporter